MLANDVEHALKSVDERDALLKVTELIKQFEAKYGKSEPIPSRIRELSPPPGAEQSVKHKVGNSITLVKDLNHFVISSLETYLIYCTLVSCMKLNGMDGNSLQNP